MCIRDRRYRELIIALRDSDKQLLSKLLLRVDWFLRAQSVATTVDRGSKKVYIATKYRHVSTSVCVLGCKQTSSWRGFSTWVPLPNALVRWRPFTELFASVYMTPSQLYTLAMYFYCVHCNFGLTAQQPAKRKKGIADCKAVCNDNDYNLLELCVTVFSSLHASIESVVHMIWHISSNTGHHIHVHWTIPVKIHGRADFGIRPLG